MTVITVGQGNEYLTMASAVQASSAGDTIDVQAGTYTNDFLTITHDLTLDAVGGTVTMLATVPPPDEKALIDEGGSGVAVSITGFDISGVSIPDDAGADGAGIRYEGGTLSLTDDVVHDNQDGLLANADPAGTITISASTFADNGTDTGSGAGFDHDIYVGAIATLTVTGSTVTGAILGHEIKSRAAATTITGSSIEDGPGGTASYDIDLPNGGVASITGNVIEKAATAQNPIVITFGEEGSAPADSSLLVSGNTILDDDDSPSSIGVNNDTSAVATVTGNALYGLTLADLVSGPAVSAGNTVLPSEPALDAATPAAGSGMADALSEGILACFVRDTRILTARGEVAVQALAVGDLVVTALGRGATLKPVRWIGRCRIDLARHPWPEAARPVRIREGALGERTPHRDLLVSPGHRLRLEGGLVCASELVNGATVVQEAPPRVECWYVEYWHVELDGHDVLLAEGAEAESYQDTGNRGAFEDGAVAALHPLPDAGADARAPEPCLPYAAAGPALRERLAVRAVALGWRRERAPLPWLEADGARVLPVRRHDRYRFVLPRGCTAAWLRSRAGRPCDTSDVADGRRLGMLLHRMALGGPGEAGGLREVALEHPLLARGFHPVERAEGGWVLRWTDGAALLPLAELAPGATVLEIGVDQDVLFWVAPREEAGAASVAA